MVSRRLVQLMVFSRMSGTMISTVTPSPPPQAAFIMCIHDHFCVPLYKLLLSLVSPITFVVSFLKRPLSILLFLFFTTTLERDDYLLRTPSNTTDSLFSDTRPSSFSPLDLIDYFGFAHPPVHMTVRLQPFQELGTVPWREIGRFPFFSHC